MEIPLDITVRQSLINRMKFFDVVIHNKDVPCKVLGRDAISSSSPHLITCTRCLRIAGSKINKRVFLDSVDKITMRTEGRALVVQ